MENIALKFFVHGQIEARSFINALKSNKNEMTRKVVQPNESGQGLVEWLLILLVIVIICVIVLPPLGQAIKKLYEDGFAQMCKDSKGAFCP